MGNLGDILNKKNYAEPPEIKAIKDYVFDHYQTSARVALRSDAIIISVPSASLANTLRLDSPRLIADCHLTKRILFRIS